MQIYARTSIEYAKICRLDTMIHAIYAKYANCKQALNCKKRHMHRYA